MKFCPSCQAEYEEIMRFCPQDGTPLVEKMSPHFSNDPNAEGSDAEKTLIRHNRADQTLSSSRFVIPTEESLHKTSSSASTPTPIEPQQTNVLSVVLLTIFGTILLLAIGFFAGYMVSSYRHATDSVTNSNVNINMNANTNANVANFNAANFNAMTNFNVSPAYNSNTNVNTNANVNLRPSPTRSPSPTVSPSPNTNGNVNTSPSPKVSPPSSPEATPSPSPTAVKIVEVGALNSRAVNLVRPSYPQIAKQVGVSGIVTVRALIDEEGNVLMAKAVSGHQLLRDAAESAAKQSKFTPVVVDGKPVKASGLIFYNFVIQQ